MNFRNLLLFKLLLILSFQNINAQFFKSGVIGGFNFTQIDGDQFNRDHLFHGFNKFGFTMGGFTNTKISKKTNLQFEIYFINKGSFGSINDGTIYYEKFNLSLNYLEIPLLIRTDASELFNIDNAELEGGLFYGRLLNYEIEDQYGKVSKRYYDQFNNYPISSSDLGFLLGVHYYLFSNLSMNYRIKRSILAIRTISYTNSNYAQKWYNFETNISLRYQFGL